MTNNVFKKLGFIFKLLSSSVAVTFLVCSLAIFIWFPYPFATEAGAYEISLIAILVNISISVLVGITIYRSTKSIKERKVDLLLIIFLLIGSLSYCIYSLYLVRPVFLSFEGDRFRVVSYADIQFEKLDSAKPMFASIPFSGPVLIASELLEPTDKEFIESVKQSLDGRHPSFRPERWRNYESFETQIKTNAKNFQKLRKTAESLNLTDTFLEKNNLDMDSVGFYPLITFKSDLWIVVISKDNAKVIGYLPLNGWD